MWYGNFFLFGMMSQNTSPRQFVISGFHRSGTSLTAQYLHRAGLHLGNNLLGAHPSNPDGHFEDQDMVDLHNDILTANNRDWYTPGPDLSTSVDGFQARAKALVNKFPAHRTFGFKDPRSSLLLPWWHQQLDNPAAIIVYRHYAGCFHSLRNRQAQNLVFSPAQNKDALFFWQQPTLALELWLSYNNALLDHLKTHRKTTLLVSHHSMLNGFNLPDAINQALGLSLDTQCNSGIRPGSNQRPGISENIDAGLKERLDTTLASLNALCCSEPEPTGANCSVDRQAAMHKNELIHTQKKTIEQHANQLHIPIPTDELLPKSEVSTRPRVAPLSIVVGSAEHSDDFKELMQWGKTHQDKQCDDAAEACWQKAHEIMPRSASPLLNLALLAKNQGDKDKTAKLLQETIKRKPENAGFHFHLARALNDCGEPEQALAMAQHGLTLQHDHSGLHLLQLNLLLTSDSLLEARNACDSALSLFPDDARFMKTKARLAGYDSDSRTAMIWFRRSVLTRIREMKDYRKTLQQAVEQVPENQQSALLSRVIKELCELNFDTQPDVREPKSRTTIRLAMSILVRDEADIIKENILYHAAAGVDHFIVTDNGSVDGTREILEELKQVVDLVIFDEPSHTFDQDLWMTRMGHHVRDNNNADWIINNDADEFWITHKGSLKDAIVSDLEEARSSGNTIGTLYCQRFNLIPSIESVSQAGYQFRDNHCKVISTLYETEQDNPWHENNSNSLIRILPGKVITRIDGLESIDMGNHGARHQHAKLECNSVSIAHYPVRNYEQFERKVVNFGKSLTNNSRLAPNVCRHLRFWYEQYQRGYLYLEYQKFVLPELRLKQLIKEGILSIETEVASEIVASIDSCFPQSRRAVTRN